VIRITLFFKSLEADKRPPAVLYLEDKIKDWRESGNVLFIRPKDARFEGMIIAKNPLKTDLPVMREYKWEITATKKIVDKKDMNELSKQLYRRLKRLEVQLFWDGLIFRKPRFKPLTGPLSISNLLPQVNMSNELAGLLNANQKLIHVISTLKPDEIYVTLKTGIGTESTRRLEEENGKNGLLRSILEYYNDPKEIQWEICLIKGPIDYFTSNRKTFVSIYNTLNRIADSLEEMSNAKHPF